MASPNQADKVADEVSTQLRSSGFPETTITSWWMLLKDADLQKTPHRVWESGDYETLWLLVDKTLRNKATYRSVLEKVTSDHWAERLAQSQEVQDRLFGARS